MSGETNESSERKQRVNVAIATYLEAVDAGQTLDPEEYIAAHSDIAAELEAFFANRDAFGRYNSLDANRGQWPLYRSAAQGRTSAGAKSKK